MSVPRAVALYLQKWTYTISCHFVFSQPGGCARSAKCRVEEINMSFETNLVSRKIIRGMRFLAAGTKQSSVECDRNRAEGRRWS